MRRPDAWHTGLRLGYTRPTTSRDKACRQSTHPPVEWIVSPGLVPYEAACAFMDAARQRHRRGHGARARLAARAPAALHRRHQRQRRRPARRPTAFPCTAPAAAASTPITGPASASAMSCSTSARRFGDVRAYVAALEALIIDALAHARRRRRDARRPRRRLGARGRSGRRRPRQDRRHRRAPAPLGELARLQRQRGAGPRALLRHRAVRHRATPGSPASPGSALDAGARPRWTAALRAAFERNFGPTCEADMRAALAAAAGALVAGLKTKTHRPPGWPGGRRAGTERPL